jgi:hypothetical protein
MGRKIVCYASDGNDYARLEMSAWSVRKHFGDDVELVLLTEHYWNPYVYGIKVINPSGALRDVGIFPYGWNRGGSFANLYRLAIPLLDEFKDADRVLYLDTDTLVMSPDAKGLVFDSDLGEHEMRMVPDVDDWRKKTPGLVDREVDEYAHSVMDPYFKEWNTHDRDYCNAGVTLFNLERIRANGLDWYRDRLRMFWNIELRGNFHSLDQDFINVFMDVDTSLDGRLNVIENPSGDNQPLIRHYAGAQKSEQENDAMSAGWYSCAAACKDLVGGECDLSGKRQLIVFMSHVVDQETLWRYYKLRDDTKRLNMDVLWWYNFQPGKKAEFPEDVWHEDVANILDVDEYRAPIGRDRAYHGAAAYGTMTMAEKYKDYDYMWIVEYDVCYSGDWADFFERMNRHPHDLVCEKVAPRYRESGWMWWHLSHFPKKYQQWGRQLKSLLSIARLSRRMLNELSAVYSSSRGKPHSFYECLWPTVASNEMSFLDIYASECCSGYSYTEYDMVNGIPSDKLFHSVKSYMVWNYCMLNRDSVSGDKDVIGMRSSEDSVMLRTFLDFTGMDHICMLEVGSYAGDSAKAFASSPRVDTLWCIDPWSPGYDDGDNASKSDFDSVEKRFDTVMGMYPQKIHKFKGTLQDFVEKHPEVRPDLVYIDACHKYESVKRDILSSMRLYPKVISGHDYTWSGVSKAVNEVLKGPTAILKDTSWFKIIR